VLGRTAFVPTSSSLCENLLDAFFTRKRRTVVEGFFDAEFGEPDFGHKRGAVGGEHKLLSDVQTFLYFLSDGALRLSSGPWPPVMGCPARMD
jgi:hypothetical protein